MRESTRPNPAALADDPASLERHFGGGDDLLPLWIAEPYVDLAPVVTSALQERARRGWYGYEIRPQSVFDAFWGWMSTRHGWDGSDLSTSASPSVGTSIGAVIELLTKPDEGVILQTPVFTDFKPLVGAGGRNVIKNTLALTAAGYRMDVEGLEAVASDPSTTLLILCNPHNPVGRVWTREELFAVADVCARNGVFVLADEIHADLALHPHAFTPFATCIGDTGVEWAAVHGPIKTFGLAGICDTLLVTDHVDLTERFRAMSSRLHLTRNNVFGLAAMETAYRDGAPWLEDLLELIAANASMLRDRLPEGIGIVETEGTYLAWLDFRQLGMDVPELAAWLAAEARLALSPGHWFGREGAGFARMTIAAPSDQISDAIGRLTEAVGRA
jgi:cystathionine beta-lyase